MPCESRKVERNVTLPVRIARRHGFRYPGKVSRFRALATLSLGGLVAIVVVGLYRSRLDSIQRDPSDDGLAAFCIRHRNANAVVLGRGAFDGGRDARSALVSFCALGRSTAWTVALSGDAGLGLEVVVLGADRVERRLLPRFGAGPVTYDALDATFGDVDGDGEPEVLVRRASSLGRESVLLTARNGVIREYFELLAGALEDVDRDGRMDVLTPGAVRSRGKGRGNRERRAGLLVLGPIRGSLRDGRRPSTGRCGRKSPVPEALREASRALLRRGSRPSRTGSSSRVCASVGRFDSRGYGGPRCRVPKEPGERILFPGHCRGGRHRAPTPIALSLVSVWNARTPGAIWPRP